MDIGSDQVADLNGEALGRPGITASLTQNARKIVVFKPAVTWLSANKAASLKWTWLKSKSLPGSE
jgi:hypothetical protein